MRRHRHRNSRIASAELFSRPDTSNRGLDWEQFPAQSLSEWETHYVSGKFSPPWSLSGHTRSSAGGALYFPSWSYLPPSLFAACYQRDSGPSPKYSRGHSASDTTDCDVLNVQPIPQHPPPTPHPRNRTRLPMWPTWFRQWFRFRPGLRPG